MHRVLLTAGLVLALTVACTATNEGAATTAGETPRVTDAAPTVATVRLPDDVPTDPSHAADRGCLDQTGDVAAPAGDWYPGQGGSPLGLNGDRAAGPRLTRFTDAATAAVGDVLPEFGMSGATEFVGHDGCVTHRTATFTNEGRLVLVSAWRVVSTANPFWIANEGPFQVLDDGTLLSAGTSLMVVLAVAPDGTTARVSAYGTGAQLATAGWPTTITIGPENYPLGQAPLNAAELRTIAEAVLAEVLASR